jgi:TonB family protein
VIQPQLKMNVIKTHNSGATGSTENEAVVPKSGNENGVPHGQGTGTPAPAATVGTPRPACANPNVEATVTNPVQPDYPETARDLGLGAVTAEVEVTVGPSGNLISAKIFKSAGNMAIDQAALRAARQSTYSPKLVDCQPTQGDYLFRADFQPD